jgi:cytochrome c oxidase subunit II
MTMKPANAVGLAISLPMLLAGCDRAQSVLSPHGPVADGIATLSWILFAMSAAVFAVVIISTYLAIRGSDRMRVALRGGRAVVIGGIAFPLVTLTLLLIYGAWLTQASVPRSTEKERVRIQVAGEQWWWRIAYIGDDGKTTATANEIHVPTNRVIEFALTSADVIHSFWVPRLGGKVDMVPGRTTYLRVVADRPGVHRGQCAEYCGGAHALMAFEVVSSEPDQFEKWLARQSEPAAEPTTEPELTGKALFLAAGCQACHAVRGTVAVGPIGPDLTHFGSRRSLAAGTLVRTRENIAKFITSNQHIKPQNRMPNYRIFDEKELDSITAYLQSLR